MSFMDILPFLLTGAAIAFIYIKRSKSRVKKIAAFDVPVTASRQIFFEQTPEMLKTLITDKLNRQNINIHASEGDRIVFENAKISAFHWGFLYTVDFHETAGGTNAVFGIFGMGPNPPRTKTQESYLTAFINEKVMPL